MQNFDTGLNCYRKKCSLMRIEELFSSFHYICHQKTRISQEQYDMVVKAINMKGENELNQNAP